VNDEPHKTFDQTRRDAMNETDSDALVLRADAPGIDAKVSSGSSLILQIDKGIGKQFFIVLWLSALISAFCLAAVIIGGFVLFDSFRVTRQHVKILEYDLMDIRAKTGNAHENVDPQTPQTPETPE
jgi:hypothetical protein